MKVKFIVVLITFLIFGLSVALVENSAFALGESAITIAAGDNEFDYENVAPEEEPMDEGNEVYIVPEEEQIGEGDQEYIIPEEESDSEDNFEDVPPEGDTSQGTY